MQRVGRAITKAWTLTSNHKITTFAVERLAGASGPEQLESSCAALYFTGEAPASDLLGPFSLRSIPGKGRGCVADRDLRPGDLVMAVQPIAVLHGPQDLMPSPDSLVGELRSCWGRTLSPGHRAALRQMFVGGPTASTTATADPQPPGKQPVASAPAVAAATAAERGSDGDGVDFSALVSYNAYGDEYEDLPAAHLRGGVPPRSHVGLWPHFSNLNHACAPNCVHYVVGSTMVVRAVQAVPEGSELLISYLGRDDLAPRQVRQALLQSRYGFQCDCARCRTEAELPEELQTLLQQLYDRARHELAPRFERLASAASAEAEGLDGGGGALFGDDDEAAVVPSSLVADAEGGGGGGGGGGGATAAGLAKSSSSGLTAAEIAKRALRKQQQVRPASYPSPSPSLRAQLASLEPRLEECARQLHLAIQELQEEEEATEDPWVGLGKDATATAAAAAAAGANTPGPAAPPPLRSPVAASSGRPLTRVQSAQAAAYQLLELMHLQAELTAAAAGAAAGGGGGGGGRARAAAAAAAALAACWHVLDAISRGSELQVFQASKLLSDALQASGYGRGGGGAGGKGAPTPAAAATAAAAAPPPEEVREAAALLGQSLVARYGRLRGQELTRMTQAAIWTSRGFF